MQRKILFTDLDGTLLNDQKTISERTKKALLALHEKGHVLVFSTGRPLASALEVQTSLGLTFPDTYVIAYNGSLVWNSYLKTPVIEHVISIPDVRSILSETRALAVHCHTYEDEMILFERENTEITYYRNHIHLPSRMVADIPSALRKEPYKMIAISLDRHDLLRQLQEQISRKLSDRICAAFSNENYLEFYPAAAGKGNALVALCGILKIPVSDAAAIGDEANDIPMIDAAGFGCAMSNAKEHVKEHAAFVTRRDNNHDGICELLETFFR